MWEGAALGTAPGEPPLASPPPPPSLSLQICVDGFDARVGQAVNTRRGKCSPAHLLPRARARVLRALLPSSSCSSAPAPVDWTNDWYGGNGIAGSRILFTNGGIDPWCVRASLPLPRCGQAGASHLCAPLCRHNLSVLPSNNLNPASESILIPSGSHCRQMQPSSPTDPDDVKAARALSAEILSQWLASPVARSH